MNNIISVIELSPSGIKLVVGYVFQGKVFVLDSLLGEPIRLDENGFLNKKEAQDSIRVLISTAQGTLKLSLENFVVLFPPDEFLSKEGKNSNYIVGDSVTQKDYANCINMISKQSKEDNLSVVYVDPISFATDLEGSSKEFPIGKRTENFAVYADVHMISKVTFDYYNQMLSEIGIRPYLRLIAPFACISFLNSFKAPLSYFYIQLERNYSYLSFSKDKRLLFSKSFGKGTDDIYSYAKDKLNVSFERMKELSALFGLNNDPTFPFKTREKKTLMEVSDALKEGASFFEEFKKEMNSIDPSNSFPVILLGESSKIDGFNVFLSGLLQRDVLSFTPKVIGARSESFIPCLGGIRITSNSFMPLISVNKIKEQNETFTRSSFSRG